MTVPFAPTAARRVFLILTATRWFPVGLIVGLTTLRPLEQGLSIAETLTATSVLGLVVFVLELPTSGVADAVGRRPVLLVGAAIWVVAAALYLLADSFWTFVAAAAVTGVFRALDSGPLEAWFVDTVHATEPGADVDRTLSQERAVMGAAMASGSLLSGLLVWWQPVDSWSALTPPYVLYVALVGAHLGAVFFLMREPPTPDAGSGVRGALTSARAAPAVVGDGLRLLRTNRVLRALVLVEVFWAAGMVVFESFQSIRLAELLGSEAEAGALMGPVAACAWGVFALGSGLAGLASGRIGVARTAITARVLNGLGAVVMGLVAGPATLIAAYLLTYGLHGSNGPMHSALLHREARKRNRATVLSMNSMVGSAALVAAALTLGRLAEANSTQTAMVLGGALSVLGAWCYLPSLRRERESEPQLESHHVVV